VLGKKDMETASTRDTARISVIKVYEVSYYKSSAVAEMGDRASEK